MGNKKLVYFGISFADNRRIYYPGNLIIGQLTAQLIKPMKMKALRLEFVGQAFVFWTETRTVTVGDTQITETITFTATESLFKNSIILQGEGSDANQEKVLQQGQHTIPFQFQLPSSLPTSFEGVVGHIRYSVNGVINRKKKDLTTHAVITVLDILDLNTVPNVLIPTGASGSKSLCCWCCKSGPIELDFHGNRSGYVPGEWIMINATISNSSNSKVKSVSAILVQFSQFHAVGKTYFANKDVAIVTGPGCDRNSSITWDDGKLHIPPLPPSECKHCRIIDISYSLKFVVHLRTCAVDLTKFASVTIGTIPINNIPMNGNPPIAAMPEPMMLTPSAPPVGLVNPSFTDLGVPNTEPPSYNSATGNPVSPPVMCYAESIQDHVQLNNNKFSNGDTSYVPQYTYYNWNQPA